MHTLIKVYDPLSSKGIAPWWFERTRSGSPLRLPSGSEDTEVVEGSPDEEVAWSSKLAVLVDGCTRRHYEEGPLDEKCGGRMTQAPLEESEQAPLGVHPKSTSHLPPRCTGGVTGLPSKGAALEPKWLHTPPETLTLSLSLCVFISTCAPTCAYAHARWPLFLVRRTDRECRSIRLLNPTFNAEAAATLASRGPHLRPAS